MEHNQDIFLQNQGTFFDFQKRAGDAFPPLVARLLFPSVL